MYTSAPLVMAMKWLSVCKAYTGYGCSESSPALIFLSDFFSRCGAGRAASLHLCSRCRPCDCFPVRSLMAGQRRFKVNPEFQKAGYDLTHYPVAATASYCVHNSRRRLYLYDFSETVGQMENHNTMVPEHCRRCYATLTPEERRFYITALPPHPEGQELTA